MEYVIVKWLHILSSTLLFGTGLGSAFYMFFTSRTRDVRAIAVVVSYVVVADWLFTATTVIFQPVSGFYLIHLAQIPLTTPGSCGRSHSMYLRSRAGCPSFGCRFE